MKTITKYLDELGGLVRDIRLSKIQPDKFVEEFLAAMGSIYELANNWPAGFLNAYSKLTRLVIEYEQNPNLEGVGKIGNALVAFRTAALNISAA